MHPSPSAHPARRKSRLLVAIIAGIVALGAIIGTALWIFGPAGASAETATGAPAPRADGLPAETTMGVTELKVRGLEEVAEFYESGVGLEVLRSESDEVLLGRGEEPLIRLVRSDEPLPQPDDAGLYHTAILYPDEATLAETLMQVAQNAPESYQGAADHTVSQAFYFGDPEGNGVELYVDRPREEWTWNDGMVEMGSDPLDPNQFIDEHLGDAAAGTAVVGHVHLKVGDLDEARAFYADTLGFDVVSEADGALFYSAGGYHHHLATNTWVSAGAGPRSTEVGLGSVTISLPTTADVEAVAERAAAGGFASETTPGGVIVEDPWGNRIRIVALAQ